MLSWYCTVIELPPNPWGDRLSRRRDGTTAAARAIERRGKQSLRVRIREHSRIYAVVQRVFEQPEVVLVPYGDRTAA